MRRRATRDAFGRCARVTRATPTALEMNEISLFVMSINNRRRDEPTLSSRSGRVGVFFFQKSNVGSTSIAQLNFSTSARVYTVGGGTSCCLHHATVIRGSR